MENKVPDLAKEPEIEAPDEKLLRPPTFDEKHGWMNKILLIILIVMIINLGVYFIMQWNATSSRPEEVVSTPTPTQIIPTTMSAITPEVTQNISLSPAPSIEQGACTMDARQCPDGSWVGRSGPNCEFVCPK